MADIATELSHELTRIIACPYPASLIRLADLLARADNLTVQACLHDRPPCAVTKLATIVSATLDHWTYSLCVLHSLCSSRDFRHKLLLQNPGLINDLLKRAIITPRQELDECARLCVLLLSNPLPPTIPLPDSARPFFLRVFERAAVKPNGSSLYPIYSMLNGCTSLLRLLKSEELDGLDHDLCQILSAKGKGENAMLLLWCFGIVLFMEHPREVCGTLAPEQTFAQQTTNADTSERQWKTRSGRKLFSTAEDHRKVMNMASLSVIWATKGDVGVSDTEAMEGIRIAIRTLQVIDPQVRESWPRSSAPAGQTFSKLATRILRQGIHPTVQLQALGFYATIAGEKNSMEPLVAQYELSLLDLTSIRTDSTFLGEALDISLPVFAPRLQGSSIQRILAAILGASSRIESSHALRCAFILVKRLAAILPLSAPLRSHFLLALSSNELQDSVRQFLRIDPVSLCGLNGANLCETSTTILRRELVSTTISLLLSLALAQSTDPRLQHSIIMALIGKQQQLGETIGQCSHPESASLRPAISFVQQECTPSTGQDWRKDLKSVLQSQSSHHSDSVVHFVGKICRDLEMRCETVEEPLRNERVKTKILEAELYQLREDKVFLETAKTDQDCYTYGLEEDLKNQHDKNHKLSTKLQELRGEFDEATRRADETLRIAQENFNEIESRLQSSILTQKEGLLAQSREIDRLKKDNVRLTDKLQEQVHEKASLDALYETLAINFQNVERSLEGERETVIRQSEEMNDIKQKTADLESRQHETEGRLLAATEQREQLQFQHLELTRFSEEALHDLEAKHANDLETAAFKADEEHTRLNDRLHEALQIRERTEEAYREIQTDLRLVQGTVPMLETRIQELTDDCLGKDEELQKLKHERIALQAFLNGSADNPVTIDSGLQSNNALRTRATTQHRLRKPILQTEDIVPRAATGTQGVTNTAMEDVANASFSSSDSYFSQDGPTPKRTKPRRSVRTPSVQASYSSKAGLSSRTVPKLAATTKSAALKPMSPNRRHTTVGFAITEKEEDKYETQKSSDFGGRRGSLHNMEQVEFGLDGTLASTPFTPGAFTTGTGRDPEEGTTTEL
ncbi:hypothetical protein BDV95DRAFT_503161 [Massariosphaeria phaeospora]|uniref:Uncharacterized protein n=1 Tax=Massariosphaeria phaeospora TaxID=100035 RepID=A0A7C8M6I8_9PLEO|nr:hypothetical protein BDV95DRAFT_503161 [Massariosphaeria phaeospora]